MSEKMKTKTQFISNLKEAAKKNGKNSVDIKPIPHKWYIDASYELGQSLWPVVDANQESLLNVDDGYGRDSYNR